MQRAAVGAWPASGRSSIECPDFSTLQRRLPRGKTASVEARKRLRNVQIGFASLRADPLSSTAKPPLSYEVLSFSQVDVSSSPWYSAREPYFQTVDM